MPPVQYYCADCDLIFDDPGSLTEHVKLRHPIHRMEQNCEPCEEGHHERCSSFTCECAAFGHGR